MRVRFRGAIGRFEFLDARARGNSGELLAKLGIIVSDQIARPFPPGRSFPQLLSNPSIRRIPGHSCMHDAPGADLQNNEDKERAKEYIVNLRDITCPDFVAVIMEEGRPGGGARLVGTIHVSLYG